MKFRHLFGPVASRRLGVSLGVDLVVHKVCSLDCVYCECGKTTDLTTERRSWVSLDRVKAELDQYWRENGSPDYITFSGSGEPCLSRDLGQAIAYIKERQPGVRVAVLTNGTLLSDPGVRAELMPADLVVPSLDGVSEAVFRRINRPREGVTASRVIEGIREFVREFRGEVHLEIFILPGVNDTPEELALFRQAIGEIGPARVQLNSLDRPGTEAGIRPADRENLERIRQALGPDRVEIIARTPSASTKAKPACDLQAAVLSTIHRRPCTCADLSAMLGTDMDTVLALLERLEAEGVVVAKQEARGRFYHTVKT